MSEPRDFYVMEIKQKMNEEQIEKFIRLYEPFIITCASKRMNRYITYENDPAYAISLESFYKAILNYDITKGGFLNFAKILIDRDLLNYIKNEYTHSQKMDSLDTIENISDKHTVEDEVILRSEIEQLEKELEKFHISFENLADYGPKHEDTREKAKEIAKKTSQVQEFMQFVFDKLRLPVSKMCERFRVSRKVITRSREYIIAILIVYEKKLDEIKKWI